LRCSHHQFGGGGACAGRGRADEQGTRGGRRRDRDGVGRRAADAAAIGDPVVTRARKKDQRHRAREAALQILYQWDIAGGDVERAAETFFGLQWPDADPPAEALRGFASALARDTAARIETIDPLIAETAERWRPERMAVLDRLILRMAICELLRDRDTPG